MFPLGEEQIQLHRFGGGKNSPESPLLAWAAGPKPNGGLGCTAQQPRPGPSLHNGLLGSLSDLWSLRNVLCRCRCVHSAVPAIPASQSGEMAVSSCSPRGTPAPERSTGRPGGSWCKPSIHQVPGLPWTLHPLQSLRCHSLPAGWMLFSFCR